MTCRAGAALQGLAAAAVLARPRLPWQVLVWGVGALAATTAFIDAAVCVARDGSSRANNAPPANRC